MSENTENTEEVTEELTQEDIEAIAASFAEGEVPKLTHTILEIWRDLLSNIEVAREERVTPVIANRVITSYPKLNYADVPAYWDLYYDLMTELRDILDDQIATDDEALSNVEDDAVANRKHYVELLFAWSDRIAQWEEQWDATSPRAAIELAAIADVASMFMGQTGMTEALSQPQVGFEFNDDDRVALQQRLVEAAAGRAQ